MAKPLRLGARLRYPITISRLLKNPGDQVEKQEPILQYTFKYERTVGDPELGDERVNIETGIADFDSPVEGKVQKYLVKVGDVIQKDQDVVNGMQEKFALYADRFPTWAGHSDAMLQFAVWTALEAEGLGANLQHYNPLIDNRVAAEWKVPASWKLQAQLVFGGKTGAAGEKTYAPIESKYKAFGA